MFTPFLTGSLTRPYLNRSGTKRGWPNLSTPNWPIFFWTAGEMSQSFWTSRGE